MHPYDNKLHLLGSYDEHTFKESVFPAAPCSCTLECQPPTLTVALCIHCIVRATLKPNACSALSFNENIVIVLINV